MANISKISIVIPLYNKGPHISKALNSVLNQTFQDFELIVVDDGSTDGGAEAVRGFCDSRIRLISQDNMGVSAARNLGVEAAKADLIVFLDADDEWMPNHLETLMRLRKKYPEAGVYATAYLIKLPNSKIKKVVYHDIPEKPWEGIIPSYFKSGGLGPPPVSSSSVGVPKEILKNLGGFSTAVWWGEDSDLWGRIALRYPIAFSWDGTVIINAGASNRACNRREPIEENIFVRTGMEAIATGKISPEMQADLLEYVAGRQISTAWHNISIARRPAFARRNLKKCVTKKQTRRKYWTLLWAYVPTRLYVLLSDLKSRLM